ncbi:MAG: hypothetical protein GC164_13450 [Phycisphaera sp.]|nr:hypothetical protein [Phycisphaera sp.]
MSFPEDWPEHELGNTGLTVGPFALRLPFFAQSHSPPKSNTLVVVTPGDSEDLLMQTAPRITRMPVMLCVGEPAFARRLRGDIEQRLSSLGRSHVDILTLQVTDPAELKSGGALQTLFDLRSAGIAEHLGLYCGDVRGAEWLALNTAVRVIATPYNLLDQSADYRMIDAAHEHGHAVIALSLEGKQPHDTSEAVAFALATRHRALPVLDATPDHNSQPMDDDTLRQARETYRRAHPAPDPLPRSKPPEE